MRFTFAAFFALIHAGSAAISEMDYETKIGAHVTAKMVVLSCDNKGPSISFGGIVATETLDATLTFSNNVKCTKSRDEVVAATFELSTDDEFAFAKQPSSGGVGGNPHIWYIPGDSDKPLYLGRCVQGAAKDIEYGTLVEASGGFEVTAEGCDNSGGPQITLEGEFVVSSNVEGKFVFTNNKKDPATHSKTTDGNLEVSVTLLEEGEKIVFPKQGALGGVGGNPHIWLSFGDT